MPETSMTSPSPTPQPSHHQRAEQIFTKINDSYMVFNAMAKHGINFNTELLIKQEITNALAQVERETWGAGAALIESYHGEKCEERPNALDCQIHWLILEFRRRAAQEMP